MDRRRAWVLNLDAEDELARPAGATMSDATRARRATLRPALEALLRPGDVVLDEAVQVRLPAGEFDGRAWCPTPRALRTLQRAGAKVPDAPVRAVLRGANHRAFCAALGQTLPGGCWADTVEAVEETVTGAGQGRGWLLKRALGYAGRGRLRVSAGVLDAAARRWVVASLRGGDGLQVEPWVERAGDYALHGWLPRDGETVWGQPTVQVCDMHCAWRESRRAGAGEITEAEGSALAMAAREAAESLRALGYWGAFGVDAFRWRDGEGRLRWNPRCEVNARYTMGWTMGMGENRGEG